MAQTVCVTHRKDVDGLASASILMRIKSAKVVLSDYEEIVDQLRAIHNVKELFVCDLGTNEKIFDEFLTELSRIAITSHATYVDHHPIKDEMLRKISKAGIEVIHSTEECTSILLYLKFKQELPKEAALLAAYGAVTDFRDSQPVARRIIENHDRQFILLEATMLSYAIAYKGRDTRFLMEVVKSLAQMKYPHEINNVIRYSRLQASRITKLLRDISSLGKRMKNLAYMETDEAMTGNVANFLTGAFDTPIGVAYRRKGGLVEVSLRGSESCRHDLGVVVAKVAGILGGSGGGHPKASGAYVPQDRLADFLKMLDDHLD